MSLVLCPECGAKISNRAVSCPHCGFQSADPLRPISEQDQYERIPEFQYGIWEGEKEWKPNRGDLSVISYEDNKQLVAHFGDWATIQILLPDIADVIKALAKKDHIMAAKIPAYVKKLIDNGTYRFLVDKNGEILPTIRGAKGIVKNVRLQEMDLTPALAQSLNNLSAHAAMARILDEIERVGDAIRELHIELQNDRIAMAESARDQFHQARKIQNSTLRDIAMLGVIHAATDAKRTLMRNFTQNLCYIKENSGKSSLQLAWEHKRSDELSRRAIDCFQALVFITGAAQAECEGYAVLGEYESCTECLTEFRSFILGNKLDQKDTLRLLNENAGQDQTHIMNDFAKIAKNITAFESDSRLGVGSIYKYLTGSTETEGNEDG